MMAVSPAHRFGQIIGDVVEATMLPHLQKFADHHQLYLDRKGHRPCRNGTKCIWVDSNGNQHELDFVIERGGTPDKLGIPAAFIETAWRSYTKHSRAKAQEIQGAVEPLARTYRNAHPFKGAVLAGEFTSGSTTQLKSLGFEVIVFPTGTVAEAFSAERIDASFDEATPDAEVRKKVEAYEALPQTAKGRIPAHLGAANLAVIQSFMKAMRIVVSRQIERILVLPLHGVASELAAVPDAITFVRDYNDARKKERFNHYEISIRYNNGNLVDGRFNDKISAIEFLNSFQPRLPMSSGA